MASEKEIRKFLKDHRRPVAVVLAALAACMLAAPPVILGASPAGWSGLSSSALRIMALYAFTFIFMNIVTGALAPYFYAVFNARVQYRIHLTTGVLGFSLALGHGLIVLTQRYYRGFSAVWILGPVSLGLMAITIWVALDRSRLKAVWRPIHQINYLIFVAVFVKAVLIGTDFKTPGGARLALTILFSAYVGIAALAVMARLRRYQLQAAGRRKAREAGAGRKPRRESG
jgi:hypothetical protein